MSALARKSNTLASEYILIHVKTLIKTEEKAALFHRI
jgi:hypothetical protein